MKKPRRAVCKKSESLRVPLGGRGLIRASRFKYLMENLMFLSLEKAAIDIILASVAILPLSNPLSSALLSIILELLPLPSRVGTPT